MCGIAGFLEPSPLDSDAEAIVAAMAGAIAHRGPDDRGVWTDYEAGIAFGHQRLAILDLSPAGHQPMASPRGRYVVSFNGEIYNFRELAATLADETDVVWRGSSDTEVLVAAIEHWGAEEALKRLNGMFALAVWDREARVLTLARDRMGEKPLYYGTAGGIFLFGSELKALRAHPGFDASLDPGSLACMLRYDYIPAPRTIWQGISKLPAGHFLEVRDGCRSPGAPKPFWSLEQCASSGASHRFDTGADLVGNLDELLRESVRMRMLADVPLGAFLSGGIDSSLIVALMQAQSPQPVRTFTIGFEDANFDEAPRARAVAHHLGTDHTELYVTPRDALDLIPNLPIWWDEPFGDSSQIPTLLVSELSRRSVKVALSGDGGDELFGGYSRFHAMSRAWRSLKLAPWPVRSAAARFMRAIAGRPLVAGTTGRASRILAARQLEDLYRWRVSRIDEPGRLFREPPDEACPSAFGPVPFLADPTEKMMYADSETYLPEDILTKVDRASMAVSLEVRAPFLDHRLVEFAWRLPVSERIGSASGKRILRALGRRYLPAEVLQRPKMGFCVPVEQWLKGPLRSWAEDSLSQDRLEKQGLFDVSAVRKLWGDFLSGRKRHERVLWNLLMFEAWAGQNSLG